MITELVILLLVMKFATAIAKDPATSKPDSIMCDGLIFHDVYYDKELLFENFGRPYNLVMHKMSGQLFFSHTIQNGSQVDFGIMNCHVEKKDCKEVRGVPGGYAIAYDDANDDIYFGGHEGIYKYNLLSRKADFFSERGKSIWGIFVRRNFYYIEYPTQKLYVFQDSKFVKVAESIDIEIDNFFVTKQNDIYFSNKTALYKVEKSNKLPRVLDDEIAVRQITEDMYGDIYFCASNGIYSEDKPYYKLKLLASIDRAFGMTFDGKDQIIYSDKDAIYRLVASKHSRLCLDAILSSDRIDRSEENFNRRSNIIMMAS